MSNLVANEGLSYKFGPQSAQVNDGRAAHKRRDKSPHEADGVICRKNAQVSHAGCQGIERNERLALLEIILVRQGAALRMAARAGAINDAGGVLARAWTEFGR